MQLLGTGYTSISILPGERMIFQNLATIWVVGLESAQRTTTAPQFDSTIRTASTAFVQRALGNFAAQTNLASAGNITTAYAGTRIVCSGAGTYTLPTLASTTVGSKFYILASGTAITVVPSGADTITAYLTAGLTTISVTSGDSVVFTAGSANWVLEEGSTALKYSSIMAGANWTTPAQFDNTTKLATTAFVQRQGLQVSALNSYTTSTTLTAANIGGTVLGFSASAITLTLMAASSVPRGSRIEFFNVGTGATTVARAGSDTIVLNSAGNATSVVLGNGDTLTLESDGTSQWYGVAGSAQLGSSSVFGASVTTYSGYQKLPGGVIMQWGTYNTTGTSTGATVTFPIAFPTGYTTVIAAPQTNLTFGCIDTVVTVGLSSFTVVGVQVQASSSNYSAHTGYYVAIGH